RRVRPEVPAALEAVCLKAMALKPQDRYGSAKDLATDVERWLADEAVSAYREPWTARLGRWARRHRPAVAATAALRRPAVCALAISTVLIGQAHQRTKAAVRDKALAQVNALLDAEPQAVPNILRGLEPYSDTVLARLRELREAPGLSEAQRVRVRLALV